MRTVLITGIGKGIGRALSEKFLNEGWFVIGTVFSGSARAHKNLAVFQLDLSKPESIGDCIKEITKSGRGIDILINNAGVIVDQNEERVVVPTLRQTLEINLIGTIDFTERLLPLMNAGGHIINISSSAGSLSGTIKSHSPGYYPSYKISKAALNMYTVTLASRLEALKIIVSSVHPGWVRTEMGGEDASMPPEEAARYIYEFSQSNPPTGQFWFQGKRLDW